MRTSLNRLRGRSILDPRAASAEQLFLAPPFTAEVVGAIRLISTRLPLKADEDSRLLWQRESNAASEAEYDALLPLWEGFDEPFHFGYVQQVANGQGFPDARNARLSREVADSILRAPASQSVKVNLPEVVSYAEFFSWPAERRSRVRRALRDIPGGYRWQSSHFLNY